MYIQEAQTHLPFFRYITRADASPLMDSLCVWRDTALKSRYSHRLSRSVSSAFDDERTRIQDEDSGNWHSDDRGLGPRSTVELYTPVRKTVTEPSDGSASTSRKPTSSSWSRWWSRSKEGETARPDLKPLNSAPPEVVRFQLLSSYSIRLGSCIEQEGKGIRTLDDVKRTPSILSAPPLGQPPALQLSVKTKENARHTPQAWKKRYAKTLRLTSDQLVIASFATTFGHAILTY